MEKKNYRIRTYREGDEEEIVDIHPSMHAINSDRALGVEYWTWKNKLSPYFNPSLIVIAEENMEVIGFAHAQIRDFKISQKVTTKAAQPADLFIRPEHRRRGIATELTRVLRKNLRENGAIILFGVAAPETHRDFYSRRKGDNAFMIPQHFYRKTLYRRNLNCASFKSKVKSINNKLRAHPAIQNDLMKVDLTILVHLKGSPQFVLEIFQGEISLMEGEPVNNPNTEIEISKLPSSTSLFTLMKMLLTGDLKIKGVLSNLIKIYKCYKILRKINRNNLE